MPGMFRVLDRGAVMRRALLLGLLAVIASCAAAPSTGTSSPERRPFNVLFIAVDDLNDWVGCLGGHPQVRTPHIDRLAERSVTFTNAHCPAPICNPSRAALLIGKAPATTGLYYLTPTLRNCEATSDAVSLPQHFSCDGYATFGAGKIFHAGEDAAEFEQYGGQFGGFGPRPDKPISCGTTHPLWDWGAFPERDEQMPDYRIAGWTAEKLKQPHDRPFFLACGFYRPHVPLYAPQKWFDLYPLDSVQLPARRENDLADVPPYGQDLSWSAVAPRHAWIVDHGQWRHAVQSYLASVSFVDAQVGRVLAALDESGHADDTIIVLWSDHGFHLGTKQRWGKRSLWEVSTRVVMMVSVPGMTTPGQCDRPVGLIDLYPTLIDLCGLDPRVDLDGRSLTPLLKHPGAPWTWPALTTFGRGNHAVRSQHWRYIVYADGSEELYDHRTDPHEFANLAGRAEYQSVIAAHRRWLPQVNHPMAPGSTHADARPGSLPDIDGTKD